LTKTKASRDTLIISGVQHPSGASKDLNKSPFNVWTKHGPSENIKVYINISSFNVWTKHGLSENIKI